MDIGGQIRQGDVLLRRVAKIPEGCVATDAAAVVLAKGEHTGHDHRFDKSSGVIGFLKEGSDDMIGGGGRLVGGATDIAFVRVPETGASLEHTSDAPKEHASLDVPAGDYSVTRQREYVAPGLERQVVD